MSLSSRSGTSRGIAWTTVRSLRKTVTVYEPENHFKCPRTMQSCADLLKNGNAHAWKVNTYAWPTTVFTVNVNTNNLKKQFILSLIKMPCLHRQVAATFVGLEKAFTNSGNEKSSGKEGYPCQQSLSFNGVALKWPSRRGQW